MRQWKWIGFAVLLCFAVPAAAADKSVGVIMSGNVGHYQDVHKAFVAALVKEGFDQSRIDINLQRPSADPMSWTNSARKLVVADVNVLVTYGAPAALASIKETKDIPIVYAGVYDPSAVGVVAKNMTGISAWQKLFTELTSSSSTAGGACTGTGFGPTKIDGVLGVVLLVLDGRQAIAEHPLVVVDSRCCRLHPSRNHMGVSV